MAEAAALAAASSRPPVVEVIYPKCKKLEPADMSGANCIADRALGVLSMLWLGHESRGPGGALRGMGEGAQGGADPLPLEIVRRHELMGWLEALRGLHAPESAEEHQRARQRVAFQVGCVGVVCCVWAMCGAGDVLRLACTMTAGVWNSWCLASRMIGVLAGAWFCH